jgi:hypothetical protein
MENPTWRPATNGDLNAMGLQTDRRQLTTKQVELMEKPTWQPATSGDLNVMGLQTDRRQLTTK